MFVEKFNSFFGLLADENFALGFITCWFLLSFISLLFGEKLKMAELARFLNRMGFEIWTDETKRNKAKDILNKVGGVLTKNAPTTLTSLGIFFTFVGVYFGLQEIKGDMSDENIEKLINNISISFSSSVLGVFYAIGFRAAHYFLTQTSDTTSASDIHQELKQGFDTLASKFDNFAAKMVENNTNSLIKALQGVMEDFNTKINEQFGSNFQQLNEAVGQQLEWQKNNKEQMDALVAAFEQAKNNLQQVQESMSSIAQETAKIPSHMDRLSAVHAKLEAELKSIHEAMGGFAEMKDKAINAIPMIEENMRKLTGELRGVIEEEIKKISDAQYLANEAQSQASATLESLEGTVEKVTVGMEGAADDFKKRMVKILAEQEKKVEGAVAKVVNTAMQEMVDNISTVFADVYANFADFSKRIKSLEDKAGEE